jgi:predicted RNA-binding Zn-ribbon protein involved in translation (DUF1610 family)
MLSLAGSSERHNGGPAPSLPQTSIATGFAAPVNRNLHQAGNEGAWGNASRSTTMEPPPIVDPNEDFACPECGGKMWVVSAEPEKMGFERRRYECSVCLHTEAVLVAISENRR